MARKKFLRKDTFKFSRLGRRRKKKMKWRAAKGRHSKVRKRRKNYPSRPSIGYKREGRKEEVVRIHNPEELEGINPNSKIIIGKVGKKKKTEIIKKALTKNLEILNIDKEILKKIEEKKNKERGNKGDKGDKTSENENKEK